MVQISRSMATVLSESAATRMKRIGQPSGSPPHRIGRWVKQVNVVSTSVLRGDANGKTAGGTAPETGSPSASFIADVGDVP